ncbi:K+dependent Na+ exchanger related-protein [Methanolobus tindarius DSM 2278]|uniref:K+dependent Na+ exchanger related-protein n=1 Tax=Methanolobus tindarius DSM 2278 TaxID=1090322 RepID=W9DP70_METTI|nr:K+dependent Na+ exchanger related-protein [Methanolobus tindarius DSM 2278]
MTLMLVTVVLLLVSLVMITKGADWFVESAVTISEKSGIPKIIIGATIVSFATTAPEFTVSAMAAYLDHVEMTVGNAVGSAICNIGLVLGTVIAIKAIPIELHGFTRKGGFMISSALLLLAVSYDGVVSSFDGILLLLVFVGFMYYNFRLQRAVFDGNEELREKVPLSDLKKDIVLFITGALLVVIGSRILVDAGITIAEWLGIPEMIIALTLVALGTSLPELITAVSATLKGHQDISIGNILGANTMDIALILGASSQIRPLTILSQSLNYDFPIMIALMLILIIFGITGKKLERWEGGVILGVYVGYIAGLFTLFN